MLLGLGYLIVFDACVLVGLGSCHLGSVGDPGET